METGFDCEFVDGPPKDLHSECSVCLSVLRRPYLVGCCGNHFCQTCLEGVSREKKVCPLCKEEDFAAIPNKGLERVLNQKVVYCTNKKSGCEWTGELRGLDSHLNLGNIRSEELEPQAACTNGYLNGCQFVEVCCRYCPATVRRNQMNEHLEECPNKPTLCMHCKAHTATPQDLTTTHYPVCPKYPMPCPNKCGAKLQRKNVAKHVDATCPLSKIPCKYRHAGCTAVTNRKRMDQHMRSAMASHLSLMDEAYSKSTGGGSREVEQLQRQIQGLKMSHSHDIEILESDRDTLADEVFCQKAEIGKLRREIAQLKAQLSGTGLSKSKFSDTSPKSEAKYYRSSYGGAAKLDFPDSRSSLPSYSTSYKYSQADVKPTRTTTADCPDKEESGLGWKTALGGLGIAAALGVGIAGVAAALASGSSSSKMDEDSWDDDDDDY